MKKTRLGKYVIVETAAGFHVNLKGGNGQVVGTQAKPPFKTAEEAERLIFCCQKNASKLENYDWHVGKDLKNYFNLLENPNKDSVVLLKSEGYNRVSQKNKGILTMQKNGSTTTIVKKLLKKAK